MLVRRGMKRVITPAIFLAASIAAGSAQDAAPSASDLDELARDDSDREASKTDAAHVQFGSAA
jgi:hypothetical protein